MFLLDWYKQYLDIKGSQLDKKKELDYCQACETLKMQLAVANDERRFLLEKLTDKPTVEEPKQVAPVVLNPMHQSMRWSTRQQILQAESKEAAKRLKKNEESTTTVSLKEVKPLTVSEIEEELGVENG